MIQSAAMSTIVVSSLRLHIMLFLIVGVIRPSRKRFSATILVSDSPLEVTENLYAALYELRAQNISPIWVDALCINQNDVAERGIQVSRIGLIYSNAQEAIAWVGKESDGTWMLLQGMDSVDDDKVGRQKAIRAFFERPY